MNFVTFHNSCTPPHRIHILLSKSCKTELHSDISNLSEHNTYVFFAHYPSCSILSTRAPFFSSSKPFFTSSSALIHQGFLWSFSLICQFLTLHNLAICLHPLVESEAIRWWLSFAEVWLRDPSNSHGLWNLSAGNPNRKLCSSEESWGNLFQDEAVFPVCL